MEKTDAQNDDSINEQYSDNSDDDLIGDFEESFMELNLYGLVNLKIEYNFNIQVLAKQF